MRVLARLCLFAALTIALTVAGGAAAQPLHLTATPVVIDPGDPARVAVGRLIYRGGLILQSPDARFGGWSDLHVSPDGTRLTAISDHGFWLDGRLTYDAGGRLASIADARLGPLIDPSGRRLLSPNNDAEGLTTAPDGGFYVAFEHGHRIWHYPPAERPFARPPQPLATPVRLASAPANGGIEALLRLSDGRLLALVEELRDQGENLGWIASGTRWDELHYRAGDDFKPTGLAELPSGTFAAGDVVVLERRLTFLSGWGARLVRLKRGDIVPGAHLEGAELARLQLPFTVDNFEGVAAAQGPDGSARLYVISDDNYTFLQRTLLMMFELPVAEMKTPQ
jgi:hypothetical protein